MNDNEIIIKPLIFTSIIDCKPPNIRKIEEHCKNVKSLMKREPDLLKAVQSNLQSITADDTRLRDFQSGLLYLALTEPQFCSSVVSSFVILTKDNMRSVCSELYTIISSMWNRLLPECRMNVPDLLSELNPSCSDPMIDSINIDFMRRLNSGDWSDENCALCSRFFLMIDKSWKFFDSRKELHPHLFLTAGRLLLDHFELNKKKGSPRLAELVAKETFLMNHLLRNHYISTVRCGREVLRLLLHAANINEVSLLLSDIFNRPFSICGSTTDFQLLFEPFPREMALALVNHDLERWIRFILSECHDKPNTSLKRHLELLTKRYFSTTGSHLLIPHVIRYIVCNIAPENSKLQPPFYQRWSLCLYLIEICQNPTSPSFANAMLALVFDWIFYTQKTCIMAIEPAILAIHCNLQTKPQVSITILQFMMLAVRRLCPPQAMAMRQSMQSALKSIINYKVVQDLTPLVVVLFKHAKLLQEFESIFSRQLVGHYIDKCRGAHPRPPSLSLNSARKNPTPVPMAAALPGAPPAKKIALTPPITSTTNALQKVGDVQRSNSVSLPTTSTSSSSSSSLSSSSPATVAPVTVVPVPAAAAATAAVAAAAAVVTNVESSPMTVTPRHSSSPAPPVVASIKNASEKVKSTDSVSISRKDNHFDEDEEDAVLLSDPIEDESPMAQNHTDHYIKACKLSTEELNKCIRSFPTAGLRQCLTNLRDGSTVRQHTTLHRYRQDQGEAVCVCMNVLIRQLLEDESCLLSNEDNNELSRTMNTSMLNTLARIVAHLCMAWLRGSLLPSRRTDEAVKESIASPVFLIIRSVCDMSRSDSSRHVLFTFLSELHKFVPRIGYYVLYYLTVSQKESDFHSYRDFCEHLHGNNDFFTNLIFDLKLVGDESPPLLAYILPSVYFSFTNELGGKLEFFNTIFPRMDGNNMLELLGQVVLEHVNFFPSDAILNEALNSSLSLDVWSQYQFWQLINAHEIPTEKFISFMANLEYEKHDEAISHVLIMLKMDRPTESLMRMLYNRKAEKEDLLTISILHFWSISGSTELKVADITLTLIKANLKLLDKHNEKEKKRRKEELPLPPLRKILKFLDLLRVKCRNIIILQNSSIQQALQLVNSKASENLKGEFGELLALAEDVVEEDNRGVTGGLGRNLRNLSVRKSAKAEKRLNEKRSSNNSGSDSNSDDDFVDLNQKKKKKSVRADFD